MNIFCRKDRKTLIGSAWIWVVLFLAKRIGFQEGYARAPWVVLWQLKNRKHIVVVFYRVLKTRAEVWEDEKCCENASWWASVSTTFPRSGPKLSRVFLLIKQECFCRWIWCYWKQLLIRSRRQYSWANGLVLWTLTRGNYRTEISRDINTLLSLFFATNFSPTRHAVHRIIPSYFRLI